MLAGEAEQVYRRRPPLPARAPADPELARSPNAHTRPCQRRYKTISDIAREPARFGIPSRRLRLGHGKILPRARHGVD